MRGINSHVNNQLPFPAVEMSEVGLRSTHRGSNVSSSYPHHIPVPSNAGLALVQTKEHLRCSQHQSLKPSQMVSSTSQSWIDGMKWANASYCWHQGNQVVCACPL